MQTIELVFAVIGGWTVTSVFVGGMFVMRRMRDRTVRPYVDQATQPVGPTL